MVMVRCLYCNKTYPDLKYGEGCAGCKEQLKDIIGILSKYDITVKNQDTK